MCTLHIDLTGMGTKLVKASFFVTAPNWKHPNAYQQHNRIDTSWRVHTTGLYSIIKRNEQVIHATTRINLKTVELN